MINPNFHSPYGFINLAVYKSAVSQNLSLAFELLVRDTQVLYTDFSASRQRRLLAFLRCVWVATLIPNSDSAEAIHNRFYYSSDPHAAFDCDSKCTTPWVWRLTALHCFGRPNSTAAIHKYPCFVALTLSACVSAHWFRASTLSSYYSDRLSSRVPPRMELLYPSAPPREGVYLGAIKRWYLRF